MDEWTKQYGKFFGMYYFRKPILVIRDPEMLKQVFVKQFNNFEDRYLLGEGTFINVVVRRGLFFESGTDWSRIRRIMSPTFSSGKLKQLVHHINRTSHDLVDNFSKNSRIRDGIDAKTFFGAFTLDVIAGLAFGLEINSQSNFDIPFIKNAKNLMTFKTMNKIKVSLAGCFPMLFPLFERLNVGFFDSQACGYFEEYIGAMLAKRKNQPLNEKSIDFLQFLLNAEAEEDCGFNERKLSLKEIVGQCVVFIIAGYETTATTLQYMAYELARNKSVQENVRKEIKQIVGESEDPTYEQIQSMKYTSAVLSETLRMYPPVVMLSRQAKTSCTLEGVPVNAGDGIFIPVYNIGRDPELFEAPNEFNPERFTGEGNQTNNDISFLSFGFGPRHCIGVRLAQMEIKLVLVHILRRFVIQHASPDVLNLEDFSGILVPKEPIKLTVEPLVEE